MIKKSIINQAERWCSFGVIKLYIHFFILLGITLRVLVFNHHTYMSSTITPETQVATEGAPPTKEASVGVAFKASGLPVSDIALAKLKKVEPKAAMRSKYWNLRQNNKLYSRFLKLVREEALDALTVLDVGAYESPYISLFDWIPTKVATDIQLRANVWNDMDGIAFVQGDFMKLNFATVFDVVICNQQRCNILPRY